MVKEGAERTDPRQANEQRQRAAQLYFKPLARIYFESFVRQYHDDVYPYMQTGKLPDGHGIKRIARGIVDLGLGPSMIKTGNEWIVHRDSPAFLRDGLYAAKAIITEIEMEMLRRGAGISKRG